MKMLRKKPGKQSHSQYPQNLKCLEINITKEVKGLYNENSKTMKK
jgi:hypothetical protein